MRYEKPVLTIYMMPVEDVVRTSDPLDDDGEYPEDWDLFNGVA